jgi:hypothetical protein
VGGFSSLNGSRTFKDLIQFVSSSLLGGQIIDHKIKRLKVQTELLLTQF